MGLLCLSVGRASLVWHNDRVPFSRDGCCCIPCLRLLGSTDVFLTGWLVRHSFQIKYACMSVQHMCLYTYIHTYRCIYMHVDKRVHHLMLVWSPWRPCWKWYAWFCALTTFESLPHIPGGKNPKTNCGDVFENCCFLKYPHALWPTRYSAWMGQVKLWAKAHEGI